MTNRQHERRRYPRHELPCPVALLGADGAALLKARTTNVSNGGVYVALGKAEGPGALPPRMTIRLSVPRSTPNTFLLEDFRSQAAVVRTDPAAQHRSPGVALAFARPLSLDLEA